MDNRDCNQKLQMGLQYQFALLIILGNHKLFLKLSSI